MYSQIKTFLKINITEKFRYNKNRVIDFETLEKTNAYSEKTKSTLDDITWNDMNMNSVFTAINHTCSSPGEEKLYNWLRNPIDNLKDYNKRKALIKNAAGATETINGLRHELNRVGYAKFPLIEMMQSKGVSKMKALILHVLLAITNVFLMIHLVRNGITLLTVALPIVFAISMYSHYNFSQKYGRELEVLQYAIKLLKFSKKHKSAIERINPEIKSELEILLKKLKPISKKEMVIFRMEGLDLFADYINITFMLKEINYFSIADKVQALLEDLVKLYELIGELDAVMSVHKYRESLEYFCDPKLLSKTETLDFHEIYHPLIEKPVSNSIAMTKDIAITGSNMSGKSTFLRTIGLNTIFSQSICTALAKEYTSSFHRLITSISLNDALLESKSYFLMEAEAIKRMLDMKASDYPTIILIDEIFKGTNPIERYAASMEVLNDLGSGNTKVIVATHDLNILPELKGYDFYYFTERISSHTIDFDFKISSGITTTHNAVKILEYVKYPKKLIKEINERIEKMAGTSVKKVEINC